jgi:DUF438 domain-containing protein
MNEPLRNNTSRQDKLKEIIKKLHDGAEVKEVKKEFSRLIKDVSPEEISDMENALINDGFPVEEVQRLCDVHVEVFKDSLSKQKKLHKIPGHPVFTYVEENKVAKKIVKKFNKLAIKLFKAQGDKQTAEVFSEELSRLKEIDKHYTRKENQLFPFLEKKGFSGPSKVMWGKHDEVRNLFKQIDNLFGSENWKELKNTAKKLSSEIKGMIFKEEKILFPAAMRKLSEKDWINVRNGEQEIGYAWIKPGNLWDSNLRQSKLDDKQEIKVAEKKDKEKDPTFHLDEGNISINIINLILKNIPFDISYVDENNTVRYYSATEDRIFPRSPGVIGRDLQNCHPPKSLHVVNKIVESFKKKEKKSAEFWITKDDRFLHIRYFSLYDKSGNYKGILEVSNDATDVRALKGEKRLLD